MMQFLNCTYRFVAYVRIQLANLGIIVGINYKLISFAKQAKMESIKNKVIGGLEYAKTTLEKKDEDLVNRPAYFAAKKEEDLKENGAAQDAAAADVVAIASSPMNGIKLIEAKEQNLDKFQQVSFELLDIGIYYGGKTIDQVKSLPLYKSVDAYVNIDDKFDLVRKHGESLYTYIDNKFRPIIQHVFFLYDSVTKKITTYINVITTKQDQVRTYVGKTHTHVHITVNENWMRLDFDNDGSVSVEDLKKSMVGLYDFLKNFDIIETTTTIKSKIYTDAIAYMQAELHEDSKKGDDQPKKLSNGHAKQDQQQDIDGIN